MTISEVEKQINKIYQLIPSGQEEKGYLKEILLSSLKSNKPISMGIVLNNDTNEVKKRFASTLITAENINDPIKVLQRPEGIVDLYTIEWILRPALPIIKGNIEALTEGIWKNVKSDILQKESQAVCRIDMSFVGHLGTGFIIGQNEFHYIIATNAHVIESALIRYWLKYNELKLRCTFNLESMTQDFVYYELANKYLLHENLDIGFLYLEKENLDALFPIFKIAETIPNEIQNLKVGLIGHPSFNSDKDPFPKIFGFGGEFGIKRLSLGFIREFVERNWRNHTGEIFLHDASTLSGSSGSCIIDLETKKLLGLHFGGWPNPPTKVNTPSGDIIAELFEANGAIPMWRLKNDKLFEEIQFS